MKNKISIEQMELLVCEMISFLLKLGLWKDTIIFANGNKYAHTYKAELKYKGLPYVEFTENINPEEYMEGPIGGWGGKLIWECLANPEHIFDMVFEGPLYELLNNDEYEVKMADITEEGWDYIFEHTDILANYIKDEYGCCDVSEFMKLNIERRFVSSEYITWNPLVFDTWEEYLKLISGKKYAIYFENVKAAERVGVKELFLPVWEQMVEDSKREFIRICRCDGNKVLYLPDIAGHVHSEFINILDRYGLWYQMEFKWSLSCFRG